MIGTSLKVLKHYSCLWPKKKGQIFYIVNIQWTPKDTNIQTKLKINGYCDQVMKLIIDNLNVNYSNNKLKVNEYSIKTDPIIKQAIKLNKDELKTTNKCFLTDRLNKLNEQQQQEEESSLSSTSSNSTSCQNSWFTRSFKERKTVKTKRLVN